MLIINSLLEEFHQSSALTEMLHLVILHAEKYKMALIEQKRNNPIKSLPTTSNSCLLLRH